MTKKEIVERTLHLLEILYKHSDDEHPLSMNDIKRYLSFYGLDVTEKCIRQDIKDLNDSLHVITFQRGGKMGYYISDAARKFSLPELKILVDEVQTSIFISEKQSMSFIKKIMELASENHKNELNHNVRVMGRSKTNSNEIFENIDILNKAISTNKKISFQYRAWNLNMELEVKHNGALYEVSPCMLILNDNRYYLVAYQKSEEKIKHFRIEKMCDIKIIDDRRDVNHDVLHPNPEQYANKHFGMFGGKISPVSLICDNELIGVMIDQFGRGIMLVRYDENRFKINIDTGITDLFFAWTCAFPGRVIIDGPDYVVERFTKYINKISEAHNRHIKETVLINDAIEE